MKTESPSPQNVDDYIAAFPPNVQSILQEIRTIIRSAAPDADEAIKYRMPTFVLHGNLVHFAAFNKHVGFYPTPSGIEKFKKELSAYPNAKGSVQFPFDKPVPFGLIRKIVEYRTKETRQKLALKQTKKKQLRRNRRPVPSSPRPPLFCTQPSQQRQEVMTGSVPPLRLAASSKQHELAARTPSRESASQAKAWAGIARKAELSF